MLFRRLAVLLSVAVLGGVLVPPANAADSWDIPDGARITIDGHGYGHGRGLSQYGAQRAAQLGKSYREIVKYYYPGTKWAKGSGSVRIWISGDRTNDVQVAAREGLTARKVGGSMAWNLTKVKPRAERWRILPAGDRRSVLEFRTGGWHQYRKVTGGLEFAAQGKPIRLYVQGGSVEYRGVLRSVPSSPGNRITVNVLPMETYLRGVVPAETYASAWKQQALRAQAVAARSYAAYRRAHPLSRAYDLCDSARCQAYGGATLEYPTTDQAVKATATRILTYQGEPAFTEFTASSGGWTVAGDHSYLPAMRDKWDSAKDPNHAWSVDFTDDELEDEWPSVGDLTRVEISDRDGNGEWGGRAGTVTLTGDSGTLTLSGTEFYQALNLRSSWLSLTLR